MSSNGGRMTEDETQVRTVLPSILQRSIRAVEIHPPGLA